MAAPDLRVVRRPKGGSPRRALTASVTHALTAASMPVTDPQQVFKTIAMPGRRDTWQDEAWKLFRCVGELRYYVGWRANSCSRVRLVASEIDPDTGLPTGGIAEDNREGARFTEIVRKIAGGTLGQAQLIKRTVEILTVPGELWIAILVRTEMLGGKQRQVERWYAVTRKEFERGTRDGTVLIKLPDGTKHEFNKDVDGLVRVWNHDAEDASQPDSPVRACLDPLREIVRTTKKIGNADNSRLINNGILFVPSEASLPDPQAPVSADKPGGSGPQQGRRVAEKLQDMIVRVAETASKDENSMAALVPIVASAPGEHLSKIHHQEFGKDVTDTAIKTRNDAIARLAMGLDVSPERLLGLGSQSNHWSAWQIADEDVQLHISPAMETICQAIYDSVLRNMLAAEGIDPDRYVLWYDASGLTIDPDKTDEAKDAHEKGALSSASLLRVYGLPEDAGYDFAALEGWQQWAQDKVSQDPTLLRALLPLLDTSLQAIDFPEPVPALPAGDEDDGGSGASRGEEPDTEDSDPSGEHAGVGDISMAVELMVTRALELAGNRRVTTSDRAQYARLRDVPKYEFHRYMEPVAEKDVSRLIKGWDVGLDDIAARYGFDPEAVRAVVVRQARRALTSQVVDA